VLEPARWVLDVVDRQSLLAAFGHQSLLAAFGHQLSDDAPTNKRLD